MDQGPLHSSFAGDYSVLMELSVLSILASCPAAAKKCMQWQVWGVLLGIGNETYIKNWHYVGPGVTVWEVSRLSYIAVSTFAVCASDFHLMFPILQLFNWNIASAVLHLWHYNIF